MGDAQKAGVLVREALGSLETAVGEIHDSNGQIGRILRSIDEIAFQTNILALNAAVEAARSGSAGAGFAVVADEVRNLAQRSVQASKDTAEFVERNVTSADSALSRVVAVKSSWGQSGSIRDKVKAMSDEIARGSIEQDRGTQEIASSVAEVTGVTQQAAAGAEELAAASEELNAQAGLLSKTGGEAGRTGRSLSALTGPPGRHRFENRILQADKDCRVSAVLVREGIAGGDMQLSRVFFGLSRFLLLPVVCLAQGLAPVDEIARLREQVAAQQKQLDEQRKALAE